MPQHGCSSRYCLGAPRRTPGHGVSQPSTPTGSAYMRVGHGEEVGPGDTPAGEEDLERGPRRRVSPAGLRQVPPRPERRGGLTTRACVWGNGGKGRGWGETRLSEDQQARALV